MTDAMPYARTTKESVGRFKPKRFQNWLTLREVADITGKDASWIRRLERDGRIPEARRVKRGKLEIRLWSPEQVKEIKQVLSTLRPGRPRG